MILQLISHTKKTITSNKYIYTLDKILPKLEKNCISKSHPSSTTVLISMCICFISVISFIYFDKNISLYFHSINKSNIYNIAKWISMLGESQYYLVPSFIFYFYHHKKNPYKALKNYFIFISITFTGILVNIVKIIIARYRPLMLFQKGLYGFSYAFLPFSAKYLSFPSGHSVTVFSLAFCIGKIYPSYKNAIYCFAAVIAISRVIATAHYLSDVLIGAIFGIILTEYIYNIYFKKGLTCKR